MNRENIICPLETIKEYIYLVWQDNKNRDFYVVGQLSKNGYYEFEYTGEIDKAIENGFLILDIRKKFP